MDVIIFILLILLLNTILGCLAIYVDFGRVTLYDMIISVLSGLFIFICVMSIKLSDWIEDKTCHITLFEKRNRQRMK